MNVSELSDVELNRAMFNLYYTEDNDSNFNNDAFNYLAYYDLTMPLAAESEMELFLTKDPVGSRCTHYKNAVGGYASVRNKNPLRAICEVLVMIKMESK
jgi:hypothetical protein